jgi:F420-dependent oxidoreductase-like protein
VSETGFDFGLQIHRFMWPGGAAETAERLRAIAVAAEEVGFTSIWVADHLLQPPFMGPATEDVLEAYSVLSFLAAVTRRVRLGVLVSAVSLRHVTHLAKLVATVDVLSGGRAMCGIGAGHLDREHKAYGVPFPPAADRLDLLEDALELLPALWAPEQAPFAGKALTVDETVCNPRPLQEHVPIVVGGGGERRTLKLAAQFADACNIIGDADAAAAKITVLRKHCRTVGRDPDSVLVTTLTPALVGSSTEEVDALVERVRPSFIPAARFAPIIGAGTVDQVASRFSALRATGVGGVMVNLADLDGPEPVRRFAPVIDAVAGRGDRRVDAAVGV